MTASNLPESAAPQSPAMKCARSPRPSRSALCRAVRAAPNAMSTPIPLAFGYSDSKASSRQPLPVPRSRKRYAVARFGNRASTASTSVSLSGRGSSVSGDRTKSRPQNSRRPSTRLSGSRAAARRVIASIRTRSSSPTWRCGCANTSAADSCIAATTICRARRRASSSPAAASITVASSSTDPIVAPSSVSTKSPCPGLSRASTSSCPADRAVPRRGWPEQVRPRGS